MPDGLSWTGGQGSAQRSKRRAKSAIPARARGGLLYPLNQSVDINRNHGKRGRQNQPLD
jgi:hypothetical protein